MDRPENSSEPASPICVQLRAIESADLPTLFRFQCDAEANRMAAMRPRTRAEFNSHWNSVLKDSGIVVKAIVVGDALAGNISCFRSAGLHAIGYWIDRKFWGRGIATKALALLLEQVSIRPLHARAATSNPASIRVLVKNGFQIVGYQHSPANGRFLECEEAVLELTGNQNG